MFCYGKNYITTGYKIRIKYTQIIIRKHLLTNAIERGLYVSTLSSDEVHGPTEHSLQGTPNLIFNRTRSICGTLVKRGLDLAACKPFNLNIVLSISSIRLCTVTHRTGTDGQTLTHDFSIRHIIFVCYLESLKETLHSQTTFLRTCYEIAYTNSSRYLGHISI